MQVQEFKLLLKAHSDNVQQRQTRVSKYSGSSAGREGEGLPGTIASLSQNYAMFSHTGPYSAPLAPVSAPSSSSSMTGNAELRRRNVSVPNTAQQQVQMTRARYQQEESFRSAQKVEASLAQVRILPFLYIKILDLRCTNNHTCTHIFRICPRWASCSRK